MSSVATAWADVTWKRKASIWTDSVAVAMMIAAAAKSDHVLGTRRARYSLDTSTIVKIPVGATTAALPADAYSTFGAIIVGTVG